MDNFKKYCKEHNITFFFPISFILAIVPLIVRARKVELPKYTANIFGLSTTYDLFSQDKFRVLLFFSVILLILFALYFKDIIKKKDKVINIILILSAIFLLLSLCSSVISEYKEVAFWGVYNRAEGFITILCYFIIFIYSIYTFKRTSEYKFIAIPLLILIFINAFLGIFQYAGNDLIQTSLGKLIALPLSVKEETGGGLSLLYEAGKVYGTLFHYNYVGSFAAIVIPIMLVLTIIEDNISYKITLGLGFVCSVWLLFGSTSRAGLVGILLSLFVAIIVFGKVIFKNKKQLATVVGSLLALIVIVNFATSGSVFKRVPAMFKDAFSIFNNTNDFDYKTSLPLQDIVEDDKGIILKINNESLRLSFEGGKYKFTDTDGSNITINKVDNSYVLNSDKYKSISFNLYRASESSSRLDILKLIFNNNENGSFLFKVKADDSLNLIDSSTFRDVDFVEAPSIGFNGKEKLGSARGYIWSRSLPLVKDNILLGSGPDTFILQFPQNDILAKYYAYGTPNMIVDKPHNLYLQIALNEGLIALIAFLLIMLTYIVDSLKIYALKKEYSYAEGLGIASFLGVIAYLGAGIFNDSIISVAPVFWIVLGVGVALNYRNKRAYSIDN